MIEIMKLTLNSLSDRLSLNNAIMPISYYEESFGWPTPQEPTNWLSELATAISPHISAGSHYFHIQPAVNVWKLIASFDASCIVDMSIKKSINWKL